MAPLRTDLSPESLTLVAIADLKPHPRNDGSHPPAEIAHLKASLTQHGIYRNVVIAQDGTLLAGHGVVEAARQVGYTHVPAERKPYGPDDPRALQILVGDNHIARLREQDDRMLAALLQGLAAEDPAALLGTGYDAEALAALVAAQGLGAGTDADTAVVEPDAPWDRLAEVLDRWPVQDGDLWALGQHRIVHGSCLDADTRTRLLDGAVPRMIFADPPYGVSIVATNGYGGGGQRHKDLTGHYPIELWDKAARGSDGAAKPFGSKASQPVRGTVGASHIVAVGKYAPVIGDESPATAIAVSTALLAAYPEAVHVWWGGNYYADHLPASSCWLVWDKDTTGNFADCELAWTNQAKAARLFHHRWNGMLRASEHERRWHPTQKPAALAAWVYETLGTEGDVILDPFLGSAPSLLAAEQRGRVVYGCELSTEYLAIACERWHLLTGEQPQRIL